MVQNVWRSGIQLRVGYKSAWGGWKLRVSRRTQVSIADCGSGFGSDQDMTVVPHSSHLEYINLPPVLEVPMESVAKRVFAAQVSRWRVQTGVSVTHLHSQGRKVASNSGPSTASCSTRSRPSGSAPARNQRSRPGSLGWRERARNRRVRPVEWNVWEGMSRFCSRTGRQRGTGPSCRGPGRLGSLGQPGADGTPGRRRTPA